MDRIRTQYREDWKSKEMRIRQRAVALYFIDKVRRIMQFEIPTGLPDVIPHTLCRVYKA